MLQPYSGIEWTSDSIVIADFCVFAIRQKYSEKEVGVLAFFDVILDVIYDARYFLIYCTVRAILIESNDDNSTSNQKLLATDSPQIACLVIVAILYNDFVRFVETCTEAGFRCRAICVERTIGIPDATRRNDACICDTFRSRRHASICDRHAYIVNRTFSSELWFFFSFRGWQNIIRVDGEHYEEIPRYSLKREIILRRTRISRRKMYDYFEYRFLKNISIRPRARFQFFLFPFFFFYSQGPLRRILE